MSADTLHEPANEPLQAAARARRRRSRRREGVQASASYNVTPRWSLTSSTLFDLSYYLTDRDLFISNFAVSPSTAVYRKSPYWTVASMSAGLQYKDECTIFSVTYTAGIKDPAAGTKERAQTLLVRLEFRSLGAVNARETLSGPSASGEGFAPAQ